MDNQTFTINDPDALVRVWASVVLKIGFRLAAGVIAIGLAVAVVRREPLPETLGTPGDIFDALRSGRSTGILGAGIGVIILTPLATLFTILAAYIHIDNRRYASLTGVVIAILLVSLSLAAR